MCNIVIVIDSNSNKNDDNNNTNENDNNSNINKGLATYAWSNQLAGQRKQGNRPWPMASSLSRRLFRVPSPEFLALFIGPKARGPATAPAACAGARMFTRAGSCIQ